MLFRRPLPYAVAFLILALFAASGCHGGSNSVLPYKAQNASGGLIKRSAKSLTGPSTLCTIDPLATCYQVALGDALEIPIQGPSTQLCGTSEFRSFLDGAGAVYNFYEGVESSIYVSTAAQPGVPYSQQCVFTPQITYWIQTYPQTTATEIAGATALFNSNACAPSGGVCGEIFPQMVDIVFLQPTPGPSSSPSPTPSPTASPPPECVPQTLNLVFTESVARAHAQSSTVSRPKTTRRSPQSEGYFYVTCAWATPPSSGIADPPPNDNGSPPPTPMPTPIPTPTPGVVIADMNISFNGTTSQLVSFPAPTPLPILVGEQVQLVAEPASPGGPALSSLSWTFDTLLTKYIVSSYAMPDPIPSNFTGPVPSPSPFAPTATATLQPFYWVANGDTNGTWHVNVAASENGSAVSNDVYYPVARPTAAVTATETTTALSTYYEYNDSGNCSPAVTFLGLHLGDECTSPGITWTYSATIPSGLDTSSGQIMMTQLVYDTIVGNKMSDGSPVNWHLPGGYNLDNVAPYAAPNTLSMGSGSWAPSSGTYYDAPAKILNDTSGNLRTLCSPYAPTESFYDYFMFKAEGSRPSVWVSLEFLKWSYGGSVTWTSPTTWNITPDTTLTQSVDAHPTINFLLPSWTATLNNLTASTPCLH